MAIYLGRNLNEILEKEEYIRKLPLKKRRFVEAYMTTLNVQKAAKLTRTSLKNAYSLLQSDEIQTAISYYQDLTSYRNTITQDYFITKLKEIVESPESKMNEKINALGLLARITGHVRDKQETGDKMVIVHVENNLTQDTEEDETIVDVS